MYIGLTVKQFRFSRLPVITSLDSPLSCYSKSKPAELPLSFGSLPSFFLVLL